MLTDLHIENVAVIKNTDVEFGPGFNVFTGETGAGKSIVIDSINLLTGARGDRELIRTGEKSALVSAVFSDISARAVSGLAEQGVAPDANGELLITRTVSLDGKGTIRINGRPATLSVLREAAKYLINIHGQNDNKALLDDAEHIKLLDLYAGNGELLEKYSDSYDRLCSLRSAIKKADVPQAEKERLTELLGYQIKEIDSLRLREGEEEELIKRSLTLRNIEKIAKQARTVFRALHSNDKGVTSASLARKAAEALSGVSDVYDKADAYIEKLESFAYEMEEIAESVRSEVGIGDADPTVELNEVETRLEQIKKAKRKYGDTVESMLEYRKKIGRELDGLEKNEDRVAEMKREYSETAEKALSLARELRKRRSDAAKRLEKEVCRYLAYLDMPSVEFRVDIRSDESKFNAYGMDFVVFLLSANKGEELKSLSKTASGGEASRIMLALKSVLRDKDGVETVIFDEIDTGISGKTSSKIGRLLHTSASESQVICITHSAQIAACADAHFLIEKKTVGDRTESTARCLTEDERINELARIMGGAHITDTLIGSARELYESSREVGI